MCHCHPQGSPTWLWTAPTSRSRTQWLWFWGTGSWKCGWESQCAGPFVQTLFARAQVPSHGATSIITPLYYLGNHGSPVPLTGVLRFPPGSRLWVPRMLPSSTPPHPPCPFTAGLLWFPSAVFQLMGDLESVTCPSGPQLPKLY